MKNKKNNILIMTEGAYEDYAVSNIYKIQKTFDTKEVLTRMKRYAKKPITVKSFYKWLIKNGFIKKLIFTEWYEDDDTTLYEDNDTDKELSVK